MLSLIRWRILVFNVARFKTWLMLSLMMWMRQFRFLVWKHAPSRIEDMGNVKPDDVGATISIPSLEACVILWFEAL